MEVMMTITTLLANNTPQCFPNQTAIDKCSSTLKESAVAKSTVCCIDTASFTPLTVLCTIPTGTVQQTAANAIIDLPADGDNCYPNKIECNDNALYPTILQEWETSTTNSLILQHMPLHTPPLQALSSLLLSLMMTTIN